MVDGVNAAEHPIAIGGTPRRWQNVTARMARTGGLEGRVVDPGGAVVPSFTAVASRWIRTSASWARRGYERPRPISAAASGLDLPPGDYWVVALDGPASLTGTALDALTSAAERVRVEQTSTVHEAHVDF